MSRIPLTKGLVPSVIDRLIDPESMGTAAKRGYSEKQMLDSIRRDLEDLLNTRQSYTEAPGGFPGLDRSVLRYGMPDFSSMAAVTASDRETIVNTVKDIIARNETRITNIAVRLKNADDEIDRSVKFEIFATLSVEPFSSVAFASDFDIPSGQLKLETETL